jgi:DNA-binding NarL/FixJ family response regulator
MSARPRVLVADDHPVMLQSLARLLAVECDVVATVSDGLAVIATAQETSPDLVVIDISMPRLNGLAVAERLEQLGSTARFVFVTMHRQHEYVEKSMARGVFGFVVKDRLAADLIAAIRAVVAGQTFVSPMAE